MDNPHKNNKKNIFSLIISILIIALIVLYQESYIKSLNPSEQIRNIQIYSKLSIDLVGAVIPSIFGLFGLFFLYIKKYIYLKEYSKNLILITAFTILLSSSSLNAVLIIPTQIAFMVGLLSFLTVFIEPDLYLLINEIIFRKKINKSTTVSKNYIALILVSYTYTVFSIIILDSTYIPFSGYTYIGGAGIVDAILLAGLISIPMSIIYFSIYNILKYYNMLFF